MQYLISLYENRIGCSIDSLAAEIKKIVKPVVHSVQVTHRIKNSETLKKKMALKGVSNIFCIDDVYGIRILVETTQEIYRALRVVEKQYPGFVDHDYIAIPKTSLDRPGQKLQLLQYIAKKNGATFEIQITTQLFNSVNESLHSEYYRKKYL